MVNSVSKKLFNSFVGSLVLCFACLPAISVAMNEDPSVVVLFGDSISFGYDSSKHNSSNDDGLGRINLEVTDKTLRDILNNNDRNSIVVNWGVGGSASGPSVNPNLSSNNGVNRISSNLAQTRNTYSGSNYFALIMYGTNDPAYSIPASTTGFNNRLLIQRANARGYIPLVATIPPCSVCSSVTPRNNAIKSAVTTEVNAGRTAYLVDQFANLNPNWASSLVSSDNLHPNTQGYQAIAQFWFDNRLESLIEPDTPVVIEPEPEPEPDDPIVVAPVINLILDE